MKVEVCVTNAIHPQDPSKVVAVQGLETCHGEHSGDEHDGKHEDRNREEGRAEMVGLRHQRQRDHRAGEDGQEHVHPAERFLVGQRTCGEEAPVLGGEDLERFRHRS